MKIGKNNTCTCNICDNIIVLFIEHRFYTISIGHCLSAGSFIAVFVKVNDFTSFGLNVLQKNKQLITHSVSHSEQWWHTGLNIICIVPYMDLTSSTHPNYLTYKESKVLQQLIYDSVSAITAINHYGNHEDDWSTNGNTTK